MTTHFYLIDFENVQPKALDRLKPGTCQIKVFLGQQQTRLLLELVQALQPFGSDAEYIQIQGSGPDAVDFHIAFYIGRLASAHPGATFDIISKDKGFDPLVRHMAKLGIGCRRLADIPGTASAAPASATPVRSAPAAKTATAARTATPAKAKAKPAVAAKPRAAKNVTVTVLPAARGAAAPKAAKAATANATTTRARAAEVVARLRKSSKPAKLSTLRSSITAWFKPALDDKAVDAVIESLQASRQIAVAGTKVTYALD